MVLWRYLWYYQETKSCCIKVYRFWVQSKLSQTQNRPPPPSSHSWKIQKLYFTSYYGKNPNNSDTRNICCNHPKIWTTWIYRRVMHPKDAEGSANSVDPDQTAPVWSGSALFAQSYLSENLRSLRYKVFKPVVWNVSAVWTVWQIWGNVA